MPLLRPCCPGFCITTTSVHVCPLHPLGCTNKVAAFERPASNLASTGPFVCSDGAPIHKPPPPPPPLPSHPVPSVTHSIDPTLVLDRQKTVNSLPHCSVETAQPSTAQPPQLFFQRTVPSLFSAFYPPASKGIDGEILAKYMRYTSVSRRCTSCHASFRVMRLARSLAFATGAWAEDGLRYRMCGEVARERTSMIACQSRA